MKLAVAVLFLHFLADFVFQTDAMAKNKSSSVGWLMRHIGAYTGVLWVGIVALGTIGYLTLTMTSLAWLAVNGVAHFAVDFVTSRINKKLWADGRVHAFFVGVGADQFVHAATLLLTLGMLR